MGSSPSTERQPSAEQQEEESLAASTVPLNILKSAFSNLSDPQSQSVHVSSLNQPFSFAPVTLEQSSPPPAAEFSILVPHFGPAAADLFIDAGKDGADWIAFLRGFNRCCARMSASSSLNLLYRLFMNTCRRAGVSCGLEFDAGDLNGGKLAGSFGASDLLMLLWFCWIMEQFPGLPMRQASINLALPVLSNMVLSVFVACGEISDDEGNSEFDGLAAGKSVSVQKLNEWILSTTPGLASCLPLFLRERIKAIAISEVDLNESNQSGGSGSSEDMNDCFLLTSGRAWTISLTQRSALGKEFSAASTLGLRNRNLNRLLYRSSTHGMGLSRFWSRIEGYQGPILFLFSGISANSSDGKSYNRSWVIGILTEHGYQNNYTFYGNSAYLYAISPTFRFLSPTGKEKNFIYSHLRPTGRVYEASPKIVGIGFGGVEGNERIFIEDDFSRVIIRHHAVDKTYQHGPLVPNQGYLPVEASLIEAEAWGFGGSSAKEQQDSFRKREELFTEQRRKVDLKTMGWEESPEKIMMDMLSNPNRVQREDR